jgi:CCGSCS motif protein
MLVAEFISREFRMEHKMSTDTQQATTETNADEAQPQTTATDVNIQVETTEEKKEEERPGVCCGSCS